MHSLDFYIHHDLAEHIPIGVLKQRIAAKADAELGGTTVAIQEITKILVLSLLKVLARQIGFVKKVHKNIIIGFVI